VLQGLNSIFRKICWLC